MDDSSIWKIIDIYFRENTQSLVKHHIDSYNQFYKEDIFRIINELNPIKIDVDYDKTIENFRSKCSMYVGGKDGSKIYFGKPIIHETNGNSHYMYPNECRLRNMSYCISIHYDVEIEYTRILRENDKPTKLDENGYAIYDETDISEENSKKIQKKNYTPSEMESLKKNTANKINSKTQIIKMKLEKIFLGKFPIMIQSNLCILDQMPREMRFSLGECKNDYGGYFIIDGKEKVIVPQEAFGDNMLNVYQDKNEDYLFSADIKSVSENISKPIRHLSIKILAPKNKKEGNNIGVFIPNAGNKPIPLFIVFRALGILSDGDIISFCTFNQPENMPNSFTPYIDACIHDAASIITQFDAVQYIAMLVKGRSIFRTMRVLADYFLPHVGEINFTEKSYFLGYMVNRLLSVATGIEPETDRDNYKFKRLTLIGPLLKDLFREYYKIQKKYIEKYFQTKYEFGKDTYYDLTDMINKKYVEAFSKREVEDGFRKAFKGNWGAYAHTKKIGILQDLNRLTHNSMISHLRKTNLPMDSSVKLVGPRVLNGSQWGILDPIDTPDGGNVGIHKHLSIMTHVTSAYSREPMIKWLKENANLKRLNEITPEMIGIFTKVFVNGYWCGCVSDPIVLTTKFKLYRRQGLIPLTNSILFDYKRNILTIFCDGGRLTRPIFYKDDNFIYNKRAEWENIQNILKDSAEISDNSDGRKTKPKKLWMKLLSGFHKKNENITYNLYAENYYNWEELYSDTPKKEINKSKAVLEYIDAQESESSLIAMDTNHTTGKDTKYTHCEIHPSTTYGVMCNLINYLEHNPAARNSFSCGQSKQACSLYSTNYQLRMDKSSVVLNNGQIPIVRSRYLEYINNEEQPYGENAIVAIMCYTGYNVEDAVLINEAAIQRGMFRTTYYTTYEAREEKEIKNDIILKEKLFNDVNKIENIQNMKPDYDYSQLDSNGLISENTIVDDKVILIGQSELIESGKRKDTSITTKKGQLGIVDKSFITEGEEGKRIAKIRIREERIPAMGDKFASRAGQKGTIGMVIPEINMPFTKDGVRPDMIINPHALPSRMTIGQMIESIVGKACCFEGFAGDCTSFYSRENKLGLFGELLTRNNFHSNGDEILYDGMSGRQLEASIFIGPTYYMRLKHMVKDKINYRSTGPLTMLTRQPVHGRANDGGLRIGEMERDAVVSHGLGKFLQESMLERSDMYQLAICNKSGTIAIYNPNKNLFFSPSADGPLKYSGSIERINNVQLNQITKHGRSFSIVNVPYSMKLLIQELQAINVQLRIITDDNVEQITNMNFSQNIDLFFDKKNVDPEMIIQEIKNKINSSGENKEDQEEENDLEDIQSIQNEKKYPSLQPEISPILDFDKINKNAKNIPEMEFNLDQFIKKENDKTINSNQEELSTNTNSPKYSSYSPAYNPSEDMLNVPAYVPSSNENSKNSPQFYLNSPYSSDNSQKGGSSHNFEVGNEVFFEGDVKKRRLWIIESIGKENIIIVTEDLDGITVQESRKLVQEKDIRKPSLYDFVPLEKEQETDNLDSLDLYEESNQTLDRGPNIQSKSSTPVATPHAPVNIIKIFNQGGVDNTQDETPNQPITKEYIETNSNEKLQNENENENENKNENQPIDFKKLIIKKEE